jgi:hypothetical protein
MDKENTVNFYKYKGHIGAVEVLYTDRFSTLKDKIGDFAIEDDTQPQANWQVIKGTSFKDAVWNI